jgi:hypothetical protein
LSSATGDLTAILATASEKSRKALAEAGDEAQAWLEEVRSGALSDSKECVTCGAGPPLEDNHVAGQRHGDLTVPNCLRCHRRFTEGQDLWPPEWQSAERSPDLDLALLLLGLHDLLLLKARHVPAAKAGAYVALAESLREQYARVARRTL